MHKLGIAIAVLLWSGCAKNVPTHVAGGVLGRVVVYRNGVAFYERTATVADGKLTVQVPRERVDDFLKSLTVVDPTTRKPLHVTIPRKEAVDGSYLTMTLETEDVRHANVLLTYVTEAPAWKPSYRVVVGEDGKVMLEGWAIVDNTTTEDWKGVLVGVGASSALAFRYDLWSVRQIDRDLLDGEQRFAVAPPTGVSPYAESSGTQELAQLDANELRPVAKPSTGEVIAINQAAPTIDPGTTAAGITLDKNYVKNVPVPGRTFESALGAAAGSQGDGIGVSFSGSTSLENQYYVDGVNTTGTSYGSSVGSSSSSAPKPPPPPPPVSRGDDKLRRIAAQVLKDKRDVHVEVHGRPGTEADAIARGTAVKNQLVNDGVPATRIAIVPRIGASESNAVRVLSVAPTAPGGMPSNVLPREIAGDTPVGESHFMADRPMTVRAGTSAMVAMVHGETKGGVVYLYDPISERGHDRFAFKAVRLDNPTGDTLEPGPVTVYGQGRFIGEGITEPVPPRASVVVPFALDKQIVVTRNHTEDERIAKLITVQRGILTADVQSRKNHRFTVTSRLPVPAKIYLRHKLAAGWELVQKPSEPMRVGDSQLFEVALGAGETKYVEIAEATPVTRTFQLGAPEALAMMKVFIEEPDASPQLKAQIEAMLATHRDAADLTDRMTTLQEQIAEYRARSNELHAQIVTLKAVKSGGPLMATLKSKLAEISERIQKATIDVVDAQEQLMLSRVKFQNQLAELRLTDATAPSVSKN